MRARQRRSPTHLRGAVTRRFARGLVLGLLATAAAACAGGYDAPTGTSPVSRITVTPEISTLGVGQSVILQIAAFDTTGSPADAGFVVSHSNRTSVRLEVVSFTSVRAIGLAPGLDRIQVSDHYLQTAGSALIRVQ